MRNVWAVLFEKCQRGWNCHITFTVTTANQFTDEVDLATGFARSWVWAYVRARRHLRKKVAEMAAKPGERAAKGWAD